MLCVSRRLLLHGARRHLAFGRPPPPPPPPPDPLPELVLGTVIVKLGLVAEAVGEEQRRFYAQFLFEPSLRCDAIGFPSAWMTSAGIGPEAGPEWLFRTPSLEQHFAARVK